MNKNPALLLAAALLLATAPGRALAADSTATVTATVYLLAPIVLTETRPLNFGRLDRPGSGTQNYTVSPSGVVGVGSGAGGSFQGGHQSGIIQVEGETGETVALSRAIPNGGVCAPGVVLNRIDLSAPSVVVSPTSSVNVGGRVNVSASAQSGLATCLYTITANYN